MLATFGTATNVIIFMDRLILVLCRPPDTDSRRAANGWRNMLALRQLVYHIIDNRYIYRAM